MRCALPGCARARAARQPAALHQTGRPPIARRSVIRRARHPRYAGSPTSRVVDAKVCYTNKPYFWPGGARRARDVSPKPIPVSLARAAHARHGDISRITAVRRLSSRLSRPARASALASRVGWLARLVWPHQHTLSRGRQRARRDELPSARETVFESRRAPRKHCTRRRERRAAKAAAGHMRAPYGPCTVRVGTSSGARRRRARVHAGALIPSGRCRRAAACPRWPRARGRSSRRRSARSGSRRWASCMHAMHMPYT